MSSSWPEAGSALPTTLWTEVLSAGRGSATALEELCRRYAGPVYAHVRRRGRSREDAQDLAQDFFVFLLESEALAKADPGRGRFRSFLYACLGNFLANEADRRAAAKRGGDRKRLSLDTEGAERMLLGMGSGDPLKAFDRQWALDTLSRALVRLKTELSPVAGRVFTLAHESPPHAYGGIARQANMTEPAVAASVSRSRKRLREILVEEVRATVVSDGEVGVELDDLLKAISAS